MDANKHELILQEEDYGVVGCAIEVLNVREHGLHEKIYENCLCVEFRLRGIPYTQQERHRVLYTRSLHLALCSLPLWSVVGSQWSVVTDLTFYACHNDGFTDTMSDETSPRR